MSTIENVWKIIKRLVTKYHVKKKRCRSQYVKRGIMLHRTSRKNLTLQCQGELQILLKQKGEIQRNTDFMM